MTKGGSLNIELYHWLGASADADPALVASAASRLAPSGVDPLRYQIGEVTGTAYAAVFDMARDECFCLIDPSDYVGGISTALARAQDIADMFNRARP